MCVESTFTMQDTLTLRELDDFGVRYFLELTEHSKEFNKLLRACDINSLSIPQRNFTFCGFTKGLKDDCNCSCNALIKGTPVTKDMI